MFEVGVVAQFEAAHRLHGDFGPASNTHGHTYRVEVSARGLRLRDDATLFDITTLQAAVDEVIGRLNYRDLDEVPGLADANTTAEIVARFVAETIAPSLHNQGLSALKVTIWESPKAFAAYETELV